MESSLSCKDGRRDRLGKSVSSSFFAAFPNLYPEVLHAGHS